MIENLDNAPRSEITVKGITLSVPAPFVEGHVLRANEASVLNQTYAENLRNNFASTVAKVVEEAQKNGTEVDVPMLQLQMDEYITSYDFGVRRASGTSRTVVDPVTREALAIATTKVKEALKKKGLNIKEIGAEKIRELAENALETYPQIRAQAQEIVRLKSSVGLESLDLG